MMQELDDDCESRIFNKYYWTCTIIWMRRQFVCLRQQPNLVQRRHLFATLELITGRKSETAIPRNIDGSRIGKTRKRSWYYADVKKKYDLPAVAPRDFLHVYIICKWLYGFSRSIWNSFALVSFPKSWNYHWQNAACNYSFLKNSLEQINFKLNSKPFDYLYKQRKTPLHVTIEQNLHRKGSNWLGILNKR